GVDPRHRRRDQLDPARRPAGSRGPAAPARRPDGPDDRPARPPDDRRARPEVGAGDCPAAARRGRLPRPLAGRLTAPIGADAGTDLTVCLHRPRIRHAARRTLRRVKTILVVDDERHIVDLVRLYLEKEGFAVLTAADGQEALDRHARHDPDLVILD